jgi:DNA polymerase III subunit delta
MMAAAIRQVSQLHKMRLALDEGMDMETVMMRGAPPVHFSRKKPVETALRSWSAARLTRAMGALADASLEARRQPIVADAIAQRTLLSLAVTARRKD